MRPRGPGTGGRHRAGDGLASCMARATPASAQHHGGTPRSCANERRYSAYTTSIPALALVCLFFKQATANVRSLPMVAAVNHCRAASTRAAGFLKATCLGQPLCVEPCRGLWRGGPDADVVKSRLCDISRMALLSHFPDMCNL